MKNRNGFTVPELLVVLAILMLLFSLVSVNLISSQTKTSVASTSVTLINDMKEQQLKAMIGDTEGSGAGNFYGIYIEQNQYTLFQGSSYVVQPTNLIVKLEGVIISNAPKTFVFSKGNGEIVSYDPLYAQIQLQNLSGGDQKTIHLNSRGVVSLIN